MFCEVVGFVKFEKKSFILLKKSVVFFSNRLKNVILL